MARSTMQLGRRTFVGDASDSGRHLATTWHRDQRLFVVSTWDAGTCVAAVRLTPEDASSVISALSAGLVDGASHDARRPAVAPHSLLEHLRTWWRYRTARASVLELRQARREGRRSTGRRCA